MIDACGVRLIEYLEAPVSVVEVKKHENRLGGAEMLR